MNFFIKPESGEIVRREGPDLSKIEPPTTSAAETMIKNLIAAAGSVPAVPQHEIERAQKILLHKPTT